MKLLIFFIKICNFNPNQKHFSQLYSTFHVRRHVNVDLPSGLALCFLSWKDIQEVCVFFFN